MVIKKGGGIGPFEALATLIFEKVLNSTRASAFGFFVINAEGRITTVDILSTTTFL